MAIAQVSSVEGIEDPYVSRILSYIIGKNPLKILSKTPGRLRKITRGLGKKALRRIPEEGKWSILEIINHMNDSEVVFAFRLRMALAQSGNPLQAIDEKRWSDCLHYQDASVKAKIETFRALREDNVTLLRALSGEEIQRFGMHEERGKETVERMAHLYAGHDVNHLQQIDSNLSG
ncbi:MAG: DinB family protein, partial [Ignavibacteria bacterium]|nr:DinB family protein [Ignavibacteria bacterium]